MNAIAQPVIRRYRQIELFSDFGQLNQIDAPQEVSAEVSAEAGNVNGTASYAVTYVTASGETEPTLEANWATVSPSNKQVTVTIPTGPSGVIARKIYRHIGDGSFLYKLKLVGTVNDNTTMLFTDNVAIGSEGAYALQVNTTGGLNRFVNSNRVCQADIGGTNFGKGAGGSSNKGMHNTNYGYLAGNSQSLTYWNTNVGAYAGEKAVDGYECVNVGYRAGQNAVNPTYCVNVGTLSGFTATAAANRTCIGYGAGAKATTASNSTHVGQRAGGEILTDTQNTSFGSNAGVFYGTSNDLLTIVQSSTYLGYETRALQNDVTAETVVGAFGRGNGSYSTTLGMWDQYFTRINGYIDCRARHFSAGIQMRRVDANQDTQAMLGWFNASDMSPATKWVLRTSSDNSAWDRDVMTIETDRSVVFGGKIQIPILTWHASGDSPTPQGRFYFGNNDSTYINGYGTTPIRLQSNYGGVAEYSTSTGWAFMVDGSLKTISVGAADSGGTGYKLLRVPN